MTNSLTTTGGPKMTHPGPAVVTPTMESAVRQTLDRVSIELNPQAGHRLSADVIGYTNDEFPIVSVINLDTREHWHLIIMTV